MKQPKSIKDWRNFLSVEVLDLINSKVSPEHAKGVYGLSNAFNNTIITEMRFKIDSEKEMS